MFATPHKVPCYRIFVHNEIVTRIERWTSWRNNPRCLIRVIRETDDLFTIVVNDPDFSATKKRASFDLISIYMHPDVIKSITSLFTLPKATEQAISALGIGEYELIVVQT